MATRHLSRIIVMQTLYQWSFHNYQKDEWKEFFEENLQEFGQDIDETEFAQSLIEGVVGNLDKIDQILKESVKSLPYEQVPLLEKSILRLATYELLNESPAVPHKVIINESIELAKNFGSPTIAKFINGVLGTVYEKIQQLKNG